MSHDNDISQLSASYGSEAYTKTIEYKEGLNVNFCIWDTFSSDYENSMPRLMTESVKGIMVCFDTTKSLSLAEAK
jgi:GTPase SAR1 family protein